MKKVYIATLISFVFLFYSNLLAISNSSTVENRIGRPNNVTEEQVLELRDQIVSRLEDALSFVKESNSRQAIRSLKLALKIITQLQRSLEDDAVVAFLGGDDVTERKKQIRQAIRHVSKGNLDKAEPLIETAIVIWEDYDFA